MNFMSSGQSNGSGAAVRTALAPATETRHAATTARTPIARPATAAATKPAGYGLPCAKCRKYYAASLGACPVCKSTERVAPVAALPCPTAAETHTEGLDEERARLLREFKAKLYATSAQINSTDHACANAKKGDQAHDGAAVCRTCYQHLQARVDVLEAALHMDLKEAAQVIYDAVWADTSDSTKTYQNAARALLGELRKRAGLSLVLGRMQPLAH